MAYLTKVVTLGYLVPETVQAVLMPRGDFLGIVEDVLDSNEQYIDIRPEMVKTASTMDRFPLGQWVNARRGCGCIVGEYLVAADIIQREDAAMLDIVEELTAAFPNTATALFRFGNKIDEAVRDHLVVSGNFASAHDTGYEGDTVLLFED